MPRQHGTPPACRTGWLQERLAALPASRGRDDFDGWHGRGLLLFRLGELADLEEDVDAFIAAAEAGSRAETLAGDIAERLTAHGRAAEALAWLDRAPARHEGEEFALSGLRAVAGRRAPSGLPARPAGLRRYRGGGPGDGACACASGPQPGAQLPGRLAEP